MKSIRASACCSLRETPADHEDLADVGELYLVFGRESRGIDPEVLDAHAEECVRLPMRESLRSLNLSNAVAIGVYETLRQNAFEALL